MGHREAPDGERESGSNPSGSRERHRRLLERLLDGVYQTSPDGRILAANPAMIEMLGYESLEELKAIDHASTLYDDPGARARWMLELGTEGQLRNEAVLKRKDGRRIVVLESAAAVHDADGRVVCFEGTITDITARKRGEEIQSVLVSLFQAAGRSKDLREFLATTHHELSRLIDTTNFYVALYDGRTGLYSFPFHVDEYEPDELEPQQLKRSLTDYVRRTGQPLLVDEEEHARLEALGEVELVGEASPIWLGVPLVTEDNVIGVLAAQSYREPDLYGPQDLDLLTVVAQNIAQMVQRKRTELELGRSEERFRDLFEASPDPIFVEDPQGNVLDANPAALELQGIERERLIGMNIAELVPPELVDDVLRRHAQLVSGEVETLESFARRPDGQDVPIELRAKVLEYGGKQAVLIQVRDITERKEHEQRLEHMARFDTLTGLPNRFLFEDRLHQALAAARRTDERLALHYVDLNEFKQVNDTHGHGFGDLVLQAAGRRLAKMIRDCDTVVRLGGDEFVIIQTAIPNATAASSFAMRVLEALSAPFQVDGHEVHISASIGITLSTPEADPAELLLQADRALYKAKGESRGHFRFHDDELAAEVQRYLMVRRDLDGAVERNEFFLEYQPQIDLATGDVVGCEALVRWQHPREGLLPPGAFIPVTENTGLIVPIGTWVLGEACRQRREWCDAGLSKVPTAVNLSAVQFRDPRFAERLKGVLNQTRVRPWLLELELTETLLMQGSDAVRRAITQSHQHGISIAVDDFGTGYSSLQYLREFPVAKLKIAMEFVQGVTENGDDAAIVAAVISLGHELGLKVIAEGVETAEQVEFLKKHDCDEAQGFYFSRPVGAEAFAEKLASNGPAGT